MPCSHDKACRKAILRETDGNLAQNDLELVLGHLLRGKRSARSTKQMLARGADSPFVFDRSFRDEKRLALRFRTLAEMLKKQFDYGCGRPSLVNGLCILDRVCYG